MFDNGSTIVKQFYEEYAAIRDLDKQNEILELVSRLNSILFASTIDNPNLNHFNSLNNDDLSKELKIIDQTDLDDNQRRKSKKNRETMNPIKSNESTNRSNETEEKSSLTSSLSLTNSSKVELNLPLSRNSSYSSNYQQDLDPDDKSDNENDLNLNSKQLLLTPIGFPANYSVTDQFLTTNYEDEKASDFSCNTSCSSTPAFQSKELANFERTKRLFNKELLIDSKNLNDDDDLNDDSNVTGDQFQISSDHLMKDERLKKLESQNEQLKTEIKQLRSQMKKYIDAISLLPNNDRFEIFRYANTDNDSHHSDNSTLINTIDDLSEQISEQINLTKNRFNSHQFNSTIRSNIENETASSDTQTNKLQINRSAYSADAYLNYRDSIEYEKKLVQVAEMFGEIVEYNDRLNRVLMQKDATIKVLKDQLIELRGPVS